MSAQPTGELHRTITRLHNDRDRAVTLFLEPWGDSYVLPARATVEIVASGPAGDGLEVVVADDSITVYGWSGSVVHLFCNGVAMGAGAWQRAPAPALPAD